jgi:hypothetical protein
MAKKAASKKITVPKKESLTGFVAIIVLIVAIAAIYYIAIGPRYGLSIEGSRLLGERLYWQSLTAELKENPPTPPATCECIAFLTPSDSVYLKQLGKGFERECSYEAAKLADKGYIPIAFLPDKCPRTVSDFKSRYLS